MPEQGGQELTSPSRWGPFSASHYCPKQNACNCESNRALLLSVNPPEQAPNRNLSATTNARPASLKESATDPTSPEAWPGRFVPCHPPIAQSPCQTENDPSKIDRVMTRPFGTGNSTHPWDSGVRA